MIDRQYRCPVCGAPIDGEKCEYCGCVIYDFANISTDEPRYIRMNINNPISGQKFLLQAKAIAVNPSVEITYDECMISDACGHIVGQLTSNQACTINLELRCIKEDDRLCTVTLYDKPYRESWRDDIEDS